MATFTCSNGWNLQSWLIYSLLLLYLFNLFILFIILFIYYLFQSTVVMDYTLTTDNS